MPGYAPEADIRTAMLPFYSLAICVVGAVLYVAVNKHEPNRRVAAALKFLIVTWAVAAIVGHLKR
jgi:hypothetical protein